MTRPPAGWPELRGARRRNSPSLERPLFARALSHWIWARFFLPLFNLLQNVAPQMMSLGVGALLIVLWHDPAWRRRLRPLTYVGRMAFTNYILQSIVCTTIFYGWELGLYGRTGPPPALGIVVVIHGLQVPLSRWWLSRFRYEPLEWAWRCLTYWSLQPFRRQPLPVAAPVEGLVP